MRPKKAIPLVVLVAAGLLVSLLWFGNPIGGRGNVSNQPQTVFIEAVPVPDVPTMPGGALNFTIVIKNPNNMTLRYTPDLTVVLYGRTDNQTISSERISLNDSFALSPHRLTDVYNGTISAGPDAASNSYWLSARSPSTAQIRVVSEQILVTLFATETSSGGPKQ